MKKKTWLKWIYLLFFLGGVFLFVIDKEWLLTNDGALSENHLAVLMQREIVTRNYALYLLQCRFYLYLVILLACLTEYSTLVLSIGISYGSFILGMMYAEGAIRYGMKGLVLVVALLLPQGLFYGLAAYVGSIHNGEKNRKYSVVIRVLFISILFAGGVITEAVCNPLFVEKIMELLQLSGMIRI